MSERDEEITQLIAAASAARAQYDELRVAAFAAYNCWANEIDVFGPMQYLREVLRRT